MQSMESLMQTNGKDIRFPLRDGRQYSLDMDYAQNETYWERRSVTRNNTARSPHTSQAIFRNRQHAGQKLAEILTPYSENHPVVISVSTGGSFVGYEIASRHHWEFHIILTAELEGTKPGQSIVGAIAENDTIILNSKTMKRQRMNKKTLTALVAEEQTKLNKRIRLFRNNKPLPSLSGRTVLLVDDGTTRETTIIAAITAIKKLFPSLLLFAVPITSSESCCLIEQSVDDYFCFHCVQNREDISQYYEDFPHVSDKTAYALLHGSRD